MDVTTNIAAQTYATPDWALIVDEIGCPLCDYNLRGLNEPRCPECGYRFAWPEVLDPARRKHPYIFEHHPESNIRSFWRTLWAGWRRSFWSDLNPAQRVYPGRLMLYWLVVSGFFLVALSAAALTWSRLRVLVAIDSLFDDEPGAFWLFLLWPWLIFSSLLIFRWSMRRAKVGTKHVLRCVVYAHDTMLLTSVGAIAVWAAYAAMMATDVWPYDRDLIRTLSATWVVLMIGGYLLAMIRLLRAYQLYMRFDHVVSMLLCVVVISLLLLANFLMLLA